MVKLRALAAIAEVLGSVVHNWCGGSQVFLIPLPGDIAPSSGLYESCRYVWYA